MVIEMHGEWLVEGALVTAAGAAITVLTLRAVRSDRYVQGVIRNVLTTYRRPITPAAVQRRVPYYKAALSVGVAIGLIVTVLGILTFIKGL